jgi:ABC-type multidrug transport system fused ATPase/permease subunit
MFVLVCRDRSFLCLYACFVVCARLALRYLIRCIECCLSRVILWRTVGDAEAVAPAAPMQVDVLQNINVRIPKGHLTLIIGAVGSGKSSFLAGLLGEIKRTKGSVRLCGSLGYCHQQVRGLGIP